jgi:hypothetical protein
MSRRALAPKEIRELKARLRLQRKVPQRPQVPTDVVIVADLNLALNLASITVTTPLVAVPPSTIILTPDCPTSPNGKSYLEFQAWGGKAASYLGEWSASSNWPCIFLPIDGGRIRFVFETIPTRIYAVEINTALWEPTPGALWEVANLVDDSAQTFPPDLLHAIQTLMVAFKANSSSSKLVLSYSVPDDAPRFKDGYHDAPCFYSCKLMLLP